MVSKKSLTPFFSIITCTRNSSKYIKKCLDSVNDQTFRDFEHLIIDGESTDDTLKIIHSYKHPVISANPIGIANAMNRGLLKARGKYIYFLNSDDSFYSPRVLQDVYKYLSSHRDLDWAFGNIHETDGEHSIGFPPKRRIFQGKHPNILKYYNYIPHQGTFVKKEIFEKFGSFDESLKSMMDPEYWLRISRWTNWDYMPITIANYLIRPDSQSEDLSHSKNNTSEYEKVQSKYLNPLELIFAKLINQIVR